MTFSSTVAQQRAQQTSTLKRFVTYSLVGSLAVHGLGMFLKVSQSTVSEDLTPDEITIVVTEPPLETLPEETPMAPPEPQLPATASTTATNPAPTATVVETPTAPPEEAPVDEPEPQPTPVAELPIEADTEETIADESVPEATSDEPTETVAEALEPRDRNLRDLLNDLRQSRPSSTNMPTPGREPGGFAPNQFNRPGIGDEETAAVGPTSPGIETNPGTEPGGEDAGDRSPRGSRSREISCQGCDFDYPDEADGAEGQAQVIVETDDQGRVISVTLSRSSGNAALDRAALEQARRRVRLNNAQAGESYPIEIDFVQPDSDAARRARERGDRRSITITEPEPETAAEPTPGATQSPTGQTPSSLPDDSLEPGASGGTQESDTPASDSPTDAHTPPSPVDSEASTDSDASSTPSPEPSVPMREPAMAPSPTPPPASPAVPPVVESSPRPSPSVTPRPSPSPARATPPTPTRPPAPVETRTPLPVEPSPGGSVDANED